MKEKVLISWSGGKDSAYCLHKILKDPSYEVAGLLTTVVRDEQRIKMHGVRTSLLKMQAESIGLDLIEVPLSDPSKNGEYERAIEQAIRPYRSRGVNGMVFGDLFLEDIKKYRDGCLERWKLKGIYPIWKIPTTDLAREMIEAGIETILSCVDTQVLPRKFAGRLFDHALLEELPESVDPCGENGEFHTFVFNAPFYRRPVEFQKGDYFLKDDRFYYCDLLPTYTQRLMEVK